MSVRGREHPNWTMRQILDVSHSVRQYFQTFQVEIYAHRRAERSNSFTSMYTMFRSSFFIAFVLLSVKYLVCKRCLKSQRQWKVSDSSVPGPRCLVESVDRFSHTICKFGFLDINKTFWLRREDFFLQSTMKKSCFDLYICQSSAMVSRHLYQEAQRQIPCSWLKYSEVVYAFSLLQRFCNQSCFVAIGLAFFRSF